MAFRNVLHFILFIWFLEFLWIIFHNKTLYSLTWFAMRTIFFISVSAMKSPSIILQFVLSSLCRIIGYLMHKGEQLYISGTSEKAGSLAYCLNNKTMSSKELQNGSHRLVLCYISKKRKGKRSEEENQSEEQSDSDSDEESDEDSFEFEDIAVQDKVDESSAKVQKRQSAKFPISGVNRFKSEENRATVFSFEPNSEIRKQTTEMSNILSNLTPETFTSALRPDIVASSSFSSRHSTYPTEACFPPGNERKGIAASSSVNKDTTACSISNFEPEIRPPSSSSSETEYFCTHGQTDMDGLGHETDESNNSFYSQQEALRFLQESLNISEGGRDINLDAAHEEQRAGDSNTCPQLLVSDYASFKASDTNDEIEKSRILASNLTQKTSLNLSRLKEQNGGEKDKTVVKGYDEKNKSSAESLLLLQEGELKSLDDGSDKAPGFEMNDDRPLHDQSVTQLHPDWVGALSANATIGGLNEYDLNVHLKNLAEDLLSIYDKVLNTNERLESHASNAEDVNIPSMQTEFSENSFNAIADDDYLSEDQQTLLAFSEMFLKATGDPPVTGLPPSEEDTGPPCCEDMGFKSKDIDPLCYEEIGFRSEDLSSNICPNKTEGTADSRPSLLDLSLNATISSISGGSRTTQSPGTSKKDNFASRVIEIYDYEIGESSQEPSVPDPYYKPYPGQAPDPSIVKKDARYQKKFYRQKKERLSRSAEEANAEPSCSLQTAHESRNPRLHEGTVVDNDLAKVRLVKAVPARHGRPKSDDEEARCRPHIAGVHPSGSCLPNIHYPESTNTWNACGDASAFPKEFSSMSKIPRNMPSGSFLSPSERSVTSAFVRLQELSGKRCFRLKIGFYVGGISRTPLIYVPTQFRDLCVENQLKRLPMFQVHDVSYVPNCSNLSAKDLQVKLGNLEDIYWVFKRSNHPMLSTFRASVVRHRCPLKLEDEDEDYELYGQSAAHLFEYR